MTDNYTEYDGSGFTGDPSNETPPAPSSTDYGSGFAGDPSNAVATGVAAVLDHYGIDYGLSPSDASLSDATYSAGMPLPGAAQAKDGDFIGTNLKKFIDGVLDPKQAPVTKMGMDLLAGMMNAKYKKATMAYQQKMGDAAALNAQTNEQLAAQRLAAGSAMGKTNFGSAMTPGNGLIYQNLLAQRQARNGA